jgi:hypothetical protein
VLILSTSHNQHVSCRRQTSPHLIPAKSLLVLDDTLWCWCCCRASFAHRRCPGSARATATTAGMLCRLHSSCQIPCTAAALSHACLLMMLKYARLHPTALLSSLPQHKPAPSTLLLLLSSWLPAALNCTTHPGQSLPGMQAAAPCHPPLPHHACLL